jgi:hypothetical protein
LIHIHLAAHDEQHIVGRDVGNSIVSIKPHDVKSSSMLFKRSAQIAGTVIPFVLQNKDTQLTSTPDKVSPNSYKRFARPLQALRRT